MHCDNHPNKKNIIIGISGATGIICAIDLLKKLRRAAITTQLITTKAAERTRAYETAFTAKQLHSLANHYFLISRIEQKLVDTATLGMIVAPCSMKTLAEIALEHTNNLLTKTAAEILSLKRPLILLTRESPLHSGHLRNIQTAQAKGAIIFPPTIITTVQSLSEMVSEITTGVMDILHGLP